MDNCSKEDDLIALRSLAAEQKCTLIENKENRGYNAGNNIGLRYAAKKGYEYALIANPDMEFPQTNYLRDLVTHMSNKNIVVCGSDIRTPEGIHQNPKVREKDDWRKSFSWIKVLLKKKGSGKIPDWIGDPYKSSYCRALNGCCILLRMSFVKAIDFFDEHIFLYGEEPILGRQVELAQKQMYYSANIYAVHDHKKSKEGTSSFCSKHWKHSQLHYIKTYSNLPFVGKLLSIVSVLTYFMTLNIYHKIKTK